MINKYDFEKISWDEYQLAVKTISNQINNYCSKNEINIDFIVPIFRGGSVLCTSLSHILSVISIYPCQYKYSEEIINGKKAYTPKRILSTIDTINNKHLPYVILVTEGNHVRGITSQLCINHIKENFPNSTIVYASVGRDYAHKKYLNGTNYECYGFCTNETETLTEDECVIKRVKHKFVVYPWENIDEEIQEVNLSLICEE